MEFTEREKKQLRKWGKSNEDIRYYSECLGGVKYTLMYSDRDISAKTAKNLLGWKSWLKGIVQSIRSLASCERKNRKTNIIVIFSYRLR